MSVPCLTNTRLEYHLAWVPKYRRRVLRGPLARRLYELLRQCAEMNRWQVEELNVQTDHVHLLVQLLPKEAVSHAVKLMKGGTSRAIRSEFPELEEFLWGARRHACRRAAGQAVRGQRLCIHCAIRATLVARAAAHHQRPKQHETTAAPLSGQAPAAQTVHHRDGQ